MLNRFGFILAGLLSLIPVIGYTQGVPISIDKLPPANYPLTGNELVPCYQQPTTNSCLISQIVASSGLVTPGTGPAIAQYDVGTGSKLVPAVVSGDVIIAQGGKATVTGLNGNTFDNSTPLRNGASYSWNGTLWYPSPKPINAQDYGISTAAVDNSAAFNNAELSAYFAGVSLIIPSGNYNMQAPLFAYEGSRIEGTTTSCLVNNNSQNGFPLIAAWQNTPSGTTGLNTGFEVSNLCLNLNSNLGGGILAERTLNATLNRIVFEKIHATGTTWTWTGDGGSTVFPNFGIGIVGTPTFGGYYAKIIQPMSRQLGSGVTGDVGIYLSSTGTSGKANVTQIEGGAIFNQNIGIQIDQGGDTFVRNTDLSQNNIGSTTGTGTSANPRVTYTHVYCENEVVTCIELGHASTYAVIDGMASYSGTPNPIVVDAGAQLPVFYSRGRGEEAQPILQQAIPGEQADYFLAGQKGARGIVTFSNTGYWYCNVLGGTLNGQTSTPVLNPACDFGVWGNNDGVSQPAEGASLALTTPSVWSATGHESGLKLYTVAHNSIIRTVAAQISSDGGIIVGNPVGGDQGPGSVNMQECLVNGVPCATIAGGGGNMNGTGAATLGQMLIAGNAGAVLDTAKVSVMLSESGPNVILQNSVVAPPAPSGPGLVINAADNTSEYIEGNTYGQPGAISLRGRRAGGTAASPLPQGTAPGGVIAAIQGLGYDGTTWTTIANVELDVNNAGIWSVTSHPTKIQSWVTPVGSINEIRVQTIEYDGTLFVGSDSSLTTHNTGLGTVNVAAGYYVDHNGAPAPLSLSDLDQVTGPVIVGRLTNTVGPLGIPYAPSNGIDTILAAIHGATVPGDCPKFSDTKGTLIDGGLCVSGGTVNSGTSGQISYYSATGTAVSGSALFSQTANGLFLNLNTVAPPTPIGPGIQINGVDNLAFTIEGDVYGSPTGFTLQGRRAGGTAASPTALGSGLTISGVTGGGYDGTAGSTNAAGAYNITSGGIWSTTSHPTLHRFYTTPVNSITQGLIATLETDGTFYIGSDSSLTTHNTGLGTINVANKIFINNSATPPPTGVATGISLNAFDNSPNVIDSVAYGTNAFTYLIGRRSAGTAASPTALAGGVIIVGLGGGGYDGTAWSSSTTPAGELDIMGGGIWSVTSHPTVQSFFTTPVNALAEVRIATLETDGTFYIGSNNSLTANNTGLGTINAATGITVNGVTTANRVLATPDGTTGLATARALTNNDLPNLILKKFTVATLPTCNTAAQGTSVFVTDAAATPVYNATAVGGGAVVIPVFCNGTNWTNR